MPDLNKKTMSRKNVIGDVGITVEVINDDQPGDGTSQETALATVTYKGGKPPAGQTYEVHFELLMSDDDTAIFTDTTTGKTQGSTDENGVVTKYFTDSVGETGQLIAYVKMDTGGNPEDQKPFTFDPVDPDALELVLENDDAVVDRDRGITAKATVKKNGKPLKNVEVNFELAPDDISAVFNVYTAVPLKIEVSPTPQNDGDTYSIIGTGTPRSTVNVTQTGGEGDPVELTILDNGTFNTGPQFIARWNHKNSGDGAPYCFSGTRKQVSAAWNYVSAAYAGTRTSGKSKDDGTVEADFQDPVAEVGAVEAWVELSNKHKLFAHQDFQFTLPSPNDGLVDSIRFPICPLNRNADERADE